MRRSTRFTVLPWLLLGPAVLAGMLLARFLSRPADAYTRAPHASERRVALPSLAPIVRAARGSVVGVKTVRLSPGSEAAKGGDRVVHGSGFVIHDKGLVVTNHHLVAGHERIYVEVPGQHAVAADLVGADASTDLAVLRFAPADQLHALPIGDSGTVEQGDWVVVIGNPFSYHESVTVGVVSYAGRHLTDEDQQVSNELLQFSAPVNPGSSGGPLLDLDGHVVGVTTSAHAGGAGISFAVPSKVLKWVLESLERDGRVRRGHLGLALEPLDRVTARALGVAATQGAYVARVTPQRPADLAGIRAGDVIVGYGQRPVSDAYALFDAITFSQPGTRVPIEVVRDGVRLSPLLAEIGELQPPAPQRRDSRP